VRIAILIATHFGRWEQAARMRSAYRRETPGTVAITITAGRDQAHAWRRALKQIEPDTFDLIHFTSDRVEPHPGWLRAARADGKRLAAPVLWTARGELVGEPPVDWAPAEGSMVPTMTPGQLRQFGIPPLKPDSGAKFVLRADYAFTVHD
jgi:hypothetical protein